MNLLQRFIARMCHIPLGETKVVLLPVSGSEIRLETWRKSEHMVQKSMKLSQDQVYQAQMNVLENEHPRHIVFAFGVSPNDRMAQQCRIEGYELALNNLHSMAKPIKQRETLEEVYEPPETSKTKGK